MKIVGIGLNKTGTTTLGECMQHWKQKHTSWSNEAFELWRSGNTEALMNRWVARHDSFEDWPWPLLYREIDQRFPGSKFILTKRRDAETWYNSLCKHAERTGPTAFRKYIYGHEMPAGHRDDHIRIYEEHLTSVREYFVDRPDALVEICWEHGDGWSELARFLGFEAPDTVIPHANKSPTALAMAKKQAKQYARRLFGTAPRP